tara:strand:- start:558 stop:842 length:285 start_codon:yes stop_codon:yes gene_type:complete
VERYPYWRTQKSDPTAPLLPPYPTGVPPLKKAQYANVENIIIDLWDYCMVLEDQYYETGDQAILTKFAIAIMTVQYWEDVHLNMEGIDVLTFRF